MRSEKLTLDRVRRVLRSREPRRDDPPEARPAAVAMALVEEAQGLEALFIVRADFEGDPWAGQVAFPGGRAEPGDADLAATAVRETLEETGVDLATAEPLGVLDDVYPRTPVLPPIYVRPFVFALKSKPALTLSEEVADALWVPLELLRNPASREEIELVIHGNRRRFPAYSLGNHMLWGLTERIVSTFLILPA
jgi:8-oxo-dGTP pyrophosphatase MutT (NUDIX family)